MSNVTAPAPAEPQPLGQSIKKALKEIVQPFIDLGRASRAQWGINLGYMLEGLVYFGVAGYLAIYFSEYVFKGMPKADELSHLNVMVLTAGITIAMFVLGGVPDKRGVRFALLAAFSLMLVGRVVISAGPTLLGLQPVGLWSPLHIVTLVGILFVVAGYGMYQPGAYAAVRQFTTPKTASMGYAMLYALMNLGAWLPTFTFLVRDENFLGWGIPGVFWVYTGVTLLSLILTIVILTPETVRRAIAKAKEGAAGAPDVAGERPATTTSDGTGPTDAGSASRVAWHLWLLVAAAIVLIYWRLPSPWEHMMAAVVAAIWIAMCLVPRTKRFLATHPLADAKFAFFIFSLIPVQTLFTYNILVLPQYLERAFAGSWIGEYYEVFSNLNPILIFMLVPIITAFTLRAKVYNMMIYGTLVMALPAFFLAAGPHPWALIAYIVIMTIGEAMWQPRFLQYAAEIAPPDRTGQYIGVAQFPWFLTKMLVPALYSGWMIEKYCPADGPKDTGTMWFIFACIAMASPIMLILAKGWVGRGFKERAGESESASLLYCPLCGQEIRVETHWKKGRLRCPRCSQEIEPARVRKAQE